MTKSIRNVNYADILTEIAVLQNLKEKFQNDKEVLKEIKESYDAVLQLLEKFEQDEPEQDEPK